MKDRTNPGCGNRGLDLVTHYDDPTLPTHPNPRVPLLRVMVPKDHENSNRGTK